MPRPTKTIKWTKEQIPECLQIKTDNVYTCTIDKLRRPSAIQEAKAGQKCIVILL